ncbi:MAG: hypothetical protein AMJ59_27410 [Gammaproteobacteria bacterium SG8_31]|nr:MAG: hypothetical protein AMJ59_27410 [Gammaproteobacteria bacterium SG8_31]
MIATLLREHRQLRYGEMGGYAGRKRHGVEAADENGNDEGGQQWQAVSHLRMPAGRRLQVDSGQELPELVASILQCSIA